MPTFQQNSIYKKTSKKDGKELEQFFSYSRQIRLYNLNERPEKKIFYDKELNMHFESIQSYQNYKVEIVNVLLEFDREIRKAIDFHRRLNYRYDWLEFEKCNNNGKITNVGNLTEIRSNWLQLEQRIKKDYIGGITDKYLKNISKQFEEGKHFKDIFNQYREFGLLFMEIPSKHSNTWTGKRSINLDHNSAFSLIEITEFINEDKNYKTYTIKFEQPPESPINLLEAGGELKWNKRNNLPQAVNIKIKYCYDQTIINEWNFEIERVLE